MTHRQVVMLHEARVDRRAQGRLLELCGHGFRRAEDDARGDLNHAPLFAALDYLCIKQGLGRFEARLAGSARFAGSGELLLDPIIGQQGIVIVFEFIRSEQWDMAIRALLDASHQGVGIGLSVAPNDKVDHDFVA